MPAVKLSDGPVAVTGASGYVGAHTVSALMKRGCDVRACVTDLNNADKTEFLLAMNEEHPGNVTLHQANMLEEGSYDSIFEGCIAVCHVGTPMAYGGAYKPQEVYDGATSGIMNIIGSIKKSGSVKRLVYTSSFAAIHHPKPPGYQYSETDWATDNREQDSSWDPARIVEDGMVAYSMAKVECEQLVYRLAEEDGSFDAASICPIAVVGPMLSRVHECVGSFQYAVARALAGEDIERGWQALWNVVDVRDVGEIQALMIESEQCGNGSRYLLSATDPSGELSVKRLQEHLQAMFPHIDVGSPPSAYDEMVEKNGGPYEFHGYCDKARNELGLETHAIEETIRDTAESAIALGLIEPKLK